MLVNLPTNKISENWDIFKDVLRESLPTSPYVLPDRFQRMLYAALTGYLQCFYLIEDVEPHEAYCALITQVSIDGLTGERALLIYALKILKQVDRETRMRDFASLKRVAREWNCPLITAFCGNQLIANSAIKANNGKGYVTPYLILETEE